MPQDVRGGTGDLGFADQMIAVISGHAGEETERILKVQRPLTTGIAAPAIPAKRRAQRSSDLRKKVTG